MSTTIKREALEKLRSKRSSGDAAKASQGSTTEASSREPRTGFTIGRKEKTKSKPVNVVMDAEIIESLDDLCYNLKKKSGRRVSVSEVVRAAVRRFNQLQPVEQLECLED